MCSFRGKHPSSVKNEAKREIGGKALAAARTLDSRSGCCAWVVDMTSIDAFEKHITTVKLPFFSHTFTVRTGMLEVV